MNEIYSRQPPKFQEMIKRLQETVDHEHSKRKERGGDPEIWFRPEMEGILARINWERAQLDKDPVGMRHLLRLEAQACGHYDYAHKLAIYTAELVLDQVRGP